MSFQSVSRQALTIALFCAASQSSLLAQGGPTTSFLDIDRPERQRSFFKDGAAEWNGRRVHVHLPSSALAKAKELPGGGLEFRYRSVTFRISAKNPSLARYNRRTPRGSILCFKGIVRKSKQGGETFVAAHDFRVGNLERW